MRNFTRSQSANWSTAGIDVKRYRITARYLSHKLKNSFHTGRFTATACGMIETCRKECKTRVSYLSVSVVAGVGKRSLLTLRSI